MKTCATMCSEWLKDVGGVTWRRARVGVNVPEGICRICLWRYCSAFV